MKRIILDTNIYGEIIRKDDINFVLENIRSASIVIYGASPIRNELRDVPRKEVITTAGRKMKLRSLILSLYHSLAKRDLEVTQEIMGIARNYMGTYRTIGGMTSEHKLMNDFLIVALAARHNLDIIYSQDRETMVSDTARKTYEIVNNILKLRTPVFKSYGDFKNDIRK